MTLKGAIQGDTYLRTLATAADRILNHNRYTGERRGYSFNTHVMLHKQAHIDLARSATEPCERDKVRRLLDSLDSPHLQYLVAVIETHPTLINDFEGTVAYIQSRLPSTVPTSKIAKVASTNKHTPSRSDKTVFDSSDFVKDAHGNSYKVQWYPHKEFLQLPQDVRDQLAALKVRRRRPSKGGGKHSKQVHSTRGTDRRKIATLERQLAALKKDLAEESHSDSDGSGNPNTKKKKKG
jgi:hypothetical protein